MDSYSEFRDRHCDVLADELARFTGWEVAVVGDGPSGKLGWVHAGVRAGTQRILDIDGWHDPACWIETWAPFLDLDTALHGSSECVETAIWRMSELAPSLQTRGVEDADVRERARAMAVQLITGSCQSRV